MSSWIGSQDLHPLYVRGRSSSPRLGRTSSDSTRSTLTDTSSESPESQLITPNSDSETHQHFLPGFSSPDHSVHSSTHSRGEATPRAELPAPVWPMSSAHAPRPSLKKGDDANEVSKERIEARIEAGLKRAASWTKKYTR
jgi:hypothetical protein